MSNGFQRIDVITSVQCRRRFATEEKVRYVELSRQPGIAVSVVARSHGLSQSLLLSVENRITIISEAVHMRIWVMIFALAAAILGSSPTAAISSSVGHITGIGGIVVVSKNPRALAAWYRAVLGISLEPWGGAMFRYNLPGHPPYTVWSSFSKGAKEFAHSRRDFMLNLSVDDLDALCSHLRAKRVTIYERESTPYGKFASVIDPDGTKIELWEAPKR